MKIIPGKWWMWTGHTFHKFVVRGSVLKDVQYKTVPQIDDEEDKHRIVPDGVKRIDADAFRYDDLTTQITLPESLTTIDANAFELCDKLGKIHIPASVTHIGEGAFRGCKKVKITVDKQNPRYKVIGKCLVDMIDNKLIAMMSSNEPIIPEFVSKLGYGFVCNPGRIKKIAIPEGIKNLPEYAFQQCEKLEEVILPEGLEIIGDGAFQDCKALCHISIPSSVTHIKRWAFGECEALENIVLPNGITHIERCAFILCKSLAQITLPQSLVHLGSGVCEYTKISELNIPENVRMLGSTLICQANAEKIHIHPSNPYYKNTKNGIICEKSKTLYLASAMLSEIPEGIEVIWTSAFDGNETLTSITIPAYVKKIGSRAFAGCTNLSEVTVENGVTEIGTTAFGGCDKLQCIHLPDSVTELGSHAFIRCMSLKEVRLPSQLNTIDDHTFEGCQNLSDIFIPEAVTQIGSDSFRHCRALVLKAPAGSYAIEYAKENNIPYEAT